MKDARERYNDLRKLTVLLEKIAMPGTSKQINTDRLFMNGVKNTVEVRKVVKLVFSFCDPSTARAREITEEHIFLRGLKGLCLDLCVFSFYL